MSQIDQVAQQIHSEFRLDFDGKAFISIRGTARLAGVDESSIRTALHSAGEKLSRLTAFLIESGFDMRDKDDWIQVDPDQG